MVIIGQLESKWCFTFLCQLLLLFFLEGFWENNSAHCSKKHLIAEYINVYDRVSFASWGKGLC